METQKILEMVFGSLGVTAATLSMWAFFMPRNVLRRYWFATGGLICGTVAFFGGAMFLGGMKSDFRIWLVCGGLGLAYGAGILLTRALRGEPMF